jgi:hypothetical protein
LFHFLINFEKWKRWWENTETVIYLSYGIAYESELSFLDYNIEMLYAYESVYWIIHLIYWFKGRTRLSVVIKLCLIVNSVVFGK